MYEGCNVSATFRLLEAARGLPGLRRFVYASTSSVYGRYSSGDETLSDRQHWAIDAADRCWNPISLDSSRTPCEVADRNEDSSPDFAVGSRMESAALHGLLGAMGRREATILRLRFGLFDGEQKTLSEVGRRLRITRERVRQIEKAALEKLQSRLIVSGEERRRVS